MIACKRITALAIFLRGCNQSNPSSVCTNLIKKILFQIILLFSLKKTYYFGKNYENSNCRKYWCRENKFN